MPAAALCTAGRLVGGARPGRAPAERAGYPLVSLTRESIRPLAPPDASDDRHRARRAPPRAGHRAGRPGARTHEPQPARRRGGRQGATGSSARASTPRAGEPHAERVALAACDEDPAGATLYVSLEPCCPPGPHAALHRRDRRGRHRAGGGRLRRPDRRRPSGRGLGILRDEGIAVDVLDGELAAAARLLNQPFRKHARTGRPLVVFKSAMTLDGKVATRTGDSQWISGEASRARAHRWRAESRRGRGRHRHRAGRRPAADRARRGRRAPAAPGRVRLRGRLPLDSASSCRARAEAPVIVVCSRAASRTAIAGAARPPASR